MTQSDRHSGSPRAATQPDGFTLVELMIASTMLLTLAYLVSTLTMRGMDAQKYSERMNRVTEITQDVVDEIRRGLTSSVRVFTDDAVGLGYLGIARLGSLPSPLRSQLLPSLDSNGLLEPDTATRRKTGNVLFFARYAWTDEFTTSSGTTHRIDIHRLEQVYLTPSGDGPQRGDPTGLNLARWVSEPLADGTQIDSITDAAERTEVLQHLLNQTPDMHGETHDAVSVVWLLGENPSVTGTLRQIDSTGDLVTTPVAPRNATWEILPQPEMCRAGILHYRHHSIATNFAPRVMGVGRFARVSNSGEGFPHGFEVQIIGPASARQVLVHATLVSTNRKGHRAYHDMQIVADVRDL